VIGGSILMNSIRGLMGGHQGSAHAATGGSSSPWGGGTGSAGGGEMSRDAGVNDIGRSGGKSYSAMDDADQDQDQDQDDGDFDDDYGGDDDE
jgi:hypothetical protein